MQGSPPGSLPHSLHTLLPSPEPCLALGALGQGRCPCVWLRAEGSGEPGSAVPQDPSEQSPEGAPSSETLLQPTTLDESPLLAGSPRPELSGVFLCPCPPNGPASLVAWPLCPIPAPLPPAPRLLFQERNLLALHCSQSVLSRGQCLIRFCHLTRHCSPPPRCRLPPRSILFLSKYSSEERLCALLLGELGPGLLPASGGTGPSSPADAAGGGEEAHPPRGPGPPGRQAVALLTPRMGSGVWEEVDEEV